MQGYTALMMAVRAGHTQIVQMILWKVSDPLTMRRLLNSNSRVLLGLEDGGDKEDEPSASFDPKKESKKRSKIKKKPPSALDDPLPIVSHTALTLALQHNEAAVPLLLSAGCQVSEGNHLQDSLPSLVRSLLLPGLLFFSLLFDL